MKWSVAGGMEQGTHGQDLPGDAMFALGASPPSSENTAKGEQNRRHPRETSAVRPPPRSRPPSPSEETRGRGRRRDAMRLRPPKKGWLAMPDAARRRRTRWSCLDRWKRLGRARQVGGGGRGRMGSGEVCVVDGATAGGSVDVRIFGGGLRVAF